MKNLFSSLCVTLLTVFLAACSTGPNVPDKNITLSNSTGTTITVTWQPADGTYLYYRVLLSKESNISNIDVAETNAISNAELIYQTKTTQTITVEPDTEYFVNVIVANKDQQKSLYNVTHFTSTDQVAPAPTDATLTFSGQTQTTIDVAWNQAVDANNVLYKLVYSTSNNISTLADAEANGTIAMDFTQNTINNTVSGLIPSTVYYFNVIAKDTVGNKSAYTSSSTTTATCFIGDTLITMSDGNKKRIDQIQKGDVVRSFDKHGKITTSIVKKIFSKKMKELVTLKTADSSITGTPNHPFFVDSKERESKKYPGYRNLGDFIQGDIVKTEGDGTTLGSANVLSITKTDDTETTVYNLHIGKGQPTYFANGFAVHNK